MKLLLVFFLMLLSISAQAKMYSTTFSKVENPLSEGGNWLNGETDGISWKDVRTSEHFVFGVTETKKYDDPTAILKGDWAPDQLAVATVKVISTDNLKKCCHEVELRLRSKVEPKIITGYEIMCSVVPSVPYVELMRWKGRLNKFSSVKKVTQNYCHSGDILEADVISNTITVRLNHKVVLTATDHTFTSGNPGIGFYQDGAPIDTYGFTQFMAIDSADSGWQQALAEQRAEQ